MRNNVERARALLANVYNHFLAVFALLLALAGLTYQLVQARLYWMHSLGQDGDGAQDTADADN